MQTVHSVSDAEEEEAFYILLPANKSDRMCHLVAITICPAVTGYHATALRYAEKNGRRDHFWSQLFPFMV